MNEPISPLPPLVQMLLTAYLRKGLAVVGGILLGQGVLTSDGVTMLHEQGPGLALIAVSVGWTAAAAWLKKKRATEAVAVALETPAPKPAKVAK